MVCWLNITNAESSNLNKFDLHISITATAAQNTSSIAATQRNVLVFVVKLEQITLFLSQQISFFVSCCQIYSDPILQIRHWKKSLAENKNGIFSCPFPGMPLMDLVGKFHFLMKTREIQKHLNIIFIELGMGVLKKNKKNSL